MKKKLKMILISIFLILFLSLLFIFNYYSNKNKVEAKEVKNTITKKEEEKKEKKEEKTKLKIDIKGFINNPGVYELYEDSRVIDAINISGGLKENADTSILNLSQKLEDEMVIIVYSKEEIASYKEKLKESNEIKDEKQKELVCPDTINKACITKAQKTSNEPLDEKSKIVSINTGTKEELMTISGIGEGKAESIIKYREENGEFETIEDIKNVSGIGDSLYEKIKDFITV